MKPVKHIDIKIGMDVNSLVNQMNNSGVMAAGKLAEAVNIMEKMIKDKDCKVFLGAAGALVPGGMKNILIDLIKNKYIDVFVTTGATLTHDLVEALGHYHYQGNENIDDVELEKKGIDRIYNSLMKNDVYPAIEDFIVKIKDKLPKKLDIKEFLWELGKNLESDSILKAAYNAKIPIFCPALSDSGLGLIIYQNLIKKGIIDVNAFSDLDDIQETVWTSKKCGVIYLGGGVPKNYIQQALQFSQKRGADYGVQVTMDRPETGGSSGAPLKEGISWGKMKSNAEYVTLISDTTIALPIIYAALKSRI